MSRNIKITGTEKDRTKFVSNSDAAYINGMTDYINVIIPANRIASVRRLCEIFDTILDDQNFNWLKMKEDSMNLVEERIAKSDKELSWGGGIAELLQEGYVLNFDTPFGEKNLRAKHLYNAVATTFYEESDKTSSSFGAYVFWSRQAKNNFLCRIFFGTSGVYL